MIYTFRLPVIVDQMTGATVECLYAKQGEPLKMGSKLFDLSIDLGSAFAQECPPVSFFRVVMREPVWLRRLELEPGRFSQIDEQMAIFSTAPDEDVDQPVVRAVRTTVAGIVHHDGMWTGSRL